DQDDRPAGARDLDAKRRRLEGGPGGRGRRAGRAAGRRGRAARGRWTACGGEQDRNDSEGTHAGTIRRWLWARNDTRPACGETRARRSRPVRYARGMGTCGSPITFGWRQYSAQVGGLTVTQT